MQPYTAEFIDKMDKLFDSCNSRRVNDAKVHRRAVKDGSVHVNFWKDIKKWINSWRIVNKNISRIACVSGWVLTISALLQLYNELTKSYNFKYMLTNRLNQDCIENLFSVIRGRGGHRDNPTPKRIQICPQASDVQQIDDTTW